MKTIGPEEVHAALSYPALIDALEETFSGEFSMPPRNVFLLDENSDTHDAFAVLPSWNTSLIGVKAFTYFPSNSEPLHISERSATTSSLVNTPSEIGTRISPASLKQLA